MGRQITPTVLAEDYDWQKAFEYAGPPLDADYHADGTPSVSLVRDEPETTSAATFQPIDVAEVLYYEEGEADERDWKVLGRLKDGRYFYLAAGCDYTGWDCQAGGAVVVSMDLDRLIQFGIPADDFAGMTATEGVA